MDIEKRLIDANGTYILNANDNTEHRIHFDGGIISVMDECGHCICEFDAEEAPTVDAVEVVHARWENGHCTNCTHYAEVQNIGFTCTGEIKINYKHTNYCPNCGAKMDGDV